MTTENPIPAGADHPERIARILQLALAVFGSEEKALKWLRAPKEQLDGRTPLDVAAQGSSGAETVVQMLKQIDEGFFA